MSVPVYLRPEWEAEGQLLGEFELDELDKLPPLVLHWGVYTSGDDIVNTSGQFVVDEKRLRSYFEVVLHPTDS